MIVVEIFVIIVINMCTSNRDSGFECCGYRGVMLKLPVPDFRRKAADIY